MRTAEVTPQDNLVLSILADDGRIGNFDLNPYLGDEAFEPLRDYGEFPKVVNGGYFVELKCGADLSADTIEARWQGWQESSAASRLTRIAAQKSS